MRNLRTRILLPALLCAAVLFTFACSRGEETRAGEVSTETASQAEVPPQPNELRPEPRSVEIPKEAPPAADDGRAEISTRERELAAREVLLEARERRLRERERQARTERPAPAPDPEPAEEPAEPAPAASPEPEPTAQEEPRPAEPEQVEEPAEEPARTLDLTVPAGTVFDAQLTQRLGSDTSSPGQTFRMRVAQDVTADGEVAIPAGSEILGEVTEAVPLRKVGGRAKLSLRFTDLVLPSGKTVPIEASFVQQGRSETGRDAATIGGGAAAGAILGRVLGKGGNRSRASVIGAIIGAAAGAAIASKTPGEEVVIPEGTVVNLKLDEPVEVTVQNRR